MGSIQNSIDPANGRPTDHLAGLLAHHLKKCRDSGLTDDTIRAAGLYSETDKHALQRILKWGKPPAKLAPALVIPYVDADGNNGYKRIRPDRPRMNGGKPVKYESPRGEQNRIYYPPGYAERIENLAELLITEGELKALSATQFGFPTLGLIGVFGWKQKNHERLIPELEQIKWRGKKVFLVFDSDAATNENVRDAECRLAKHLTDRGAVVKVVRLPEGPRAPDEPPAKVGLDDFLVAHGVAAFRKLLAEATEAEPPDPATSKLPAKSLDPAEEAKSILHSETTDGVAKLRYWRGTFWRWTGGQYRELERDDLRGAVVRVLNRNYFKLSMSDTSNVIDQLKAQANIPARLEPPAWLTNSQPWPTSEVLATRSGLIHLPTYGDGGDFYRKATPQFFCTTAADVDFHNPTPQPDAWLAFLAELWGEDADAISTLQRWFGYCLTADTRHQKILLLVGPKRSGKGTICRILRALVGADNVAGPTLAGLATNFGLQPLLGKSLAIVHDARLSHRADQSIVLERLLSISGEDALTVDRKYAAPVTCKIGARLMLVSNELPKLADASGALASRMILLRLTESFIGRENHELTDTLMGELPGVLQWAMAGWLRLRDAGRFVQPESGCELLGDLEDLSSPVSAFLRDACHVGPEYRAAVSDLFTAWQKWCEANGRDHPGTAATFGRDLRAALPALKVVQSRGGGTRYRAYDGVGIRGDY